MSNTPESGTRSAAEFRTRLHDVARMLRESRSMDEKVQRALAELLDELTTALAATNVPPAEVTRLAESAAHLADSLHHQHDRGLLEKARDQFRGAIIDAEVHAPIAVGLARGLIDALANIGI
jgi:hypothetical protein